MICLHDGTLYSQAGCRQPHPGGLHRRILDIQAPYMAFRTHFRGQEFRVVPVTAGRIDHPISRPDDLPDHCMYDVRNPHPDAIVSFGALFTSRFSRYRMLLQRVDQPIPVRLPEKRSYEIVFAELDTLPEAMRSVGLRAGKVLIVTDSNVGHHYRDRVDALMTADGWEPFILVLPAGEATKSPKHLHAVYDAALQWGVDRRTPIVALGGGVVGDLAGYAAATLLRGLPLVQVPTSLIAQVDSAIGGKTGINHPVGKNLIGAFHQPRLVLTDTRLLYTLERRQWTSGLAEAVKHALIADEPFFAWMEAEWPRILARDPGVVPDMVYRAAAVKARVVSDDEREDGRRALLNFGHTFAHALENVTGYGTLTHGEAVAVGMRAALFLSRRLHRQVNQVRAETILDALPIPPFPEGLTTGTLHAAMDADKKQESGALRFVLLKKLGEAYVERDVTSPDVEAAWAYALGRPC